MLPVPLNFFTGVLFEGQRHLLTHNISALSHAFRQARVRQVTNPPFAIQTNRLQAALVKDK